VEADRPDEADVPPDGHADRRDDQAAGGRTARPAGTEAETRSRQECYDQLRVAEAKEKSEAAQQATAEEQAATDKWNEDATESRWMWTEYLRKWPSEERQSADRPDTPSGSWHGEGNRVLDRATNSQVEAACDRIAERERDKITPAMHAVESQDPDRHLVGLDDRLKDRDRIKEKVCDTMEETGSSAEEAISIVPDTTRYTFNYRDSQYTKGVWADTERLKEQGFELHKLKNFWPNDQYKGINSQWIDPDTGQRFEVQFHTHISYEAKQLTHEAYERLRAQQIDEFEKLVLKAFQGKVSADVPVPPGATDIPDYQENGTDVR
jgi:hypothetical protein